VDGQVPNYPSLASKLLCLLHNVTLHVWLLMLCCIHSLPFYCISICGFFFFGLIIKLPLNFDICFKFTPIFSKVAILHCNVSKSSLEFCMDLELCGGDLEWKFSSSSYLGHCHTVLGLNFYEGFHRNITFETITIVW